MSYGGETISRLPRPLADYFGLEGIVASTASAHGYKAVDKQQRASIGLWVSREPLAVEDVSILAERVQALSQVKGVIQINAFGVDSQGIAFIVCEVFSGQEVRGNPKTELDWTERERRFVSCVRTVERVHQAGLVCEDLCLESFRINQGGGANLISVLGIPQSSRESLRRANDPERARFLAPELREGGKLTQRSDVYALAVLGYRILGGCFPDASGQVQRLGAAVPTWVDGVLVPLLSQPLAQAPEHASALLARIVAWKESEAAQSISPVLRDEATSQRDKLRKLSTAPQAVAIEYKGTRSRASNARGGELPHVIIKRLKNLSPKQIGVGALGMVLAMVAAWSVASSRAPAPLPEIAPLSLSPAEVLSEESIRQLVGSDDPLTHDTLMRSLRAAKSDPNAQSIFDGIITRTRRLGLMRSADIVKTWRRSLGERGREYDVVAPWLRLIDPALPDEERVGALRALYAQNPRLATKMAAALAFDTESLTLFQDTLVTAATEQLRIEDAQRRSPLALMLVIPELTPLFLEDVMSSASNIPDTDIPWLLRNLVRRGSLQSVAIAEMALARKLVPGSGITYLNLLRKNPNAPPEVRQALVECAFGEVTREQLAPLAKWYDSDAEQALYAIIMSSEDPAVKRAAFDTLELKPISNRLVAKIMEYSKTNAQEARSEIAQLAAVVALQDSVTSEQLEQAFNGLGKVSKPKGLVRVLLSDGSAKIVEETTKRFGALLDVSSLLELLRHPHKDVRMMAVRGLKDNNNVGVIGFLIKSYNEERDPDVRALYEHEVESIRERTAGRQGGNS